MQTWQLQEAKAKFSEVVRLSHIEPQFITVRGVEEAVLVSKEQYEKLCNKPKQPSFTEFMRNSPLFGIELNLERDKSLPRDIDFFGDE